MGDVGLVLRTNAVVDGREEKEPSWSSLVALASSLGRSSGNCSCPSSVNHQRKADSRFGSRYLLEINSRKNLI